MLGLHPWQQEDVEIAQPVEVQLEPQRVNMVVIFVTSITSSTCGENFNVMENAQPVGPQRVNMVNGDHICHQHHQQCLWRKFQFFGERSFKFCGEPQRVNMVLAKHSDC